MNNGGAERVIASLSNYFVSKGDHVSIAVSDSKESGYELFSEVNLINLNTFNVSNNIIESFRGFLRDIYTLRKLLLSVRPNIIFAFNPMYAITAKIASFRTKTLVIGAERSNPYIEQKSIKKKMAVKMTSVLNGFVFQTNGAKSFYPKKIQEKSVIIPNGIFSEIPETIPLVKDRPCYTICATGRLSQVKRYDLLIEAFDLIKDDIPEWSIHIYGDGPMKNKLEELISKKDLQRKVILEGRVSNVSKILTSHRIFVLTSDNEGMPNGLIEAMAMGLACVSVDCDFGPSEIIDDMINGILVPRGDVKALAIALKRVALDDNLATSLGYNAQRIRETHSCMTISEKFHQYLLMINNKCINK